MDGAEAFIDIYTDWYRNIFHMNNLSGEYHWESIDLSVNNNDDVEAKP